MICASHRIAVSASLCAQVRRVAQLALASGTCLAVLSCSSTPTDPSTATLSGTWKFDIAKMFGPPEWPVPCHFVFAVALGGNGETPDSLSGRFPDRVDRSCPPGTYSARNATWSETGHPLWLTRTGDQLLFFYYPTSNPSHTQSVGYGLVRTADRIDLDWPSIGATGTMERQ